MIIITTRLKQNYVFGAFNSQRRDVNRKYRCRGSVDGLSVRAYAVVDRITTYPVRGCKFNILLRTNVTPASKEYPRRY